MRGIQFDKILVSSPEDYYAAFCNGYPHYNIKMSNEQMKIELFSYLQENKDINSDYSYLYAMCLFFGVGCDCDGKKAEPLLAELSNQGYAEAQNDLGLYYHDGQGVKQDYEKAFELFEKSANQGYVMAQNNLGRFYLYGQGVK